MRIYIDRVFLLNLAVDYLLLLAAARLAGIPLRRLRLLRRLRVEAGGRRGRRQLIVVSHGGRLFVLSLSGE